MLLHGQPGGRGDWGAVTRRLADDFLVIAPDRPGYGQTGGRARGFQGNAAAVIGLLDQLGVEQATVVGYSWAGGAALALAQQAPDRLLGMVLVASVSPDQPLSRMDRLLAVPPIGTAVTAGGLFLASGALSLPPVRRALERRRGPPPLPRPPGPSKSRRTRLARHAVAGIDQPGHIPDHADVDHTDIDHSGAGDTRTATETGPAFTHLGRDLPDPDALVSSWRSSRVWQSFVTEQRCLIDELPSLGVGLAAITVATVVLQGDSDRTVPPASGQRLAAALPRARLVQLVGAGHMVIHQYPEAVASAVRNVTPR